jgi:hypothetical protein
MMGALAVAGVSAMLPVLQNSAATSRGFALQQRQVEQQRLKGDIGLIEADVARLTSLPRIERRADEIGLVPTTDPIYITVTEPGPAPAKIPAEYLPPPAPKASRPASWWRSFLDWLPLPD